MAYFLSHIRISGYRKGTVPTYKHPVLNCWVKGNPHDYISKSRTVLNTHLHYHQRHYHPREMHKLVLMTMSILMLVLGVAASPPRALKQAKIKRDEQGVPVVRDWKPKPSKT